MAAPGDLPGGDTGGVSLGLRTAARLSVYGDAQGRMLDRAGKAGGSNPAIEGGESAPYHKEHAAETRAAAGRGEPPIESIERMPPPR